MNLDDAIALATGIRNKLLPLCLRCEIAGSIRRKKPSMIKDVEICLVPNPQHLFEIKDLINSAWGKPAIGAFPSKYCRIRAYVNIDFFIPTLPEWGLNFFIRTGSAEFAQRALAHWKKITGGGYSESCQLHYKDGIICPTPEETDVFQALQCKFLPPEKRV